MHFESRLDGSAAPSAGEFAPESGPPLALEALSRRIDQANSLKDIVAIRELAKAARRRFELDRSGLAKRNEAAELVLRADRKAGKLLAALRLRGGTEPLPAGSR